MTLIRIEYVGDGHFIDSVMFNVIGCSSFVLILFMSWSFGGVFIIIISVLMLSYREGLGSFDVVNLFVQFKVGIVLVIAAFWQCFICIFGVLCEVEDLSYDGLAVAFDHFGYTGFGFVVGFQNVGNLLFVLVHVDMVGMYQFDVRYANS